MKNILYYFQLLFLTHKVLARVVDYFDSDFDKNKNCKHEEKMDTYGKQGNRCVVVSKGKLEENLYHHFIMINIIQR